MTSTRARRARRTPRPPRLPGGTWWLLPPAALAVLLVLAPLVGLVQAVPFDRLGDVLTDDATRDALRLSVVVPLVALAVDLVLGVPLAWVLARTRLPGRAVLRALVTLPLVLPPVVAGLALLLVAGRRTTVGGVLEDLTGQTLSFSTTGAVLAAAVVSLPFAVLPVEAALRGVDPALEEAARVTGASPVQVLRRVTLPLVAPSLFAAAALTWARALGEFGATVTVAGDVPGVTRTLPLAVVDLARTDPDAAAALGLLLLAVAVVVLVALRRRLAPG